MVCQPRYISFYVSIVVSICLLVGLFAFCHHLNIYDSCDSVFNETMVSTEVVLVPTVITPQEVDGTTTVFANVSDQTRAMASINQRLKIYRLNWKSQFSN